MLHPVPDGYELASHENSDEIYLAADGSTYYRWMIVGGDHLMREGWRCPIGRPHRTGGLPAIIRYAVDGSVRNEEWYVDGRPSRFDGPAKIEYEPFENLVVESWYLSGVHTKTGDLTTVVASLPPAELEREIACSVYVALLDEGITVEQIAAAVAEGLVAVGSVRAHAEGAPIEWIRSFEDGEMNDFSTLG